MYPKNRISCALFVTVVVFTVIEISEQWEMVLYDMRKVRAENNLCICPTWLCLLVSLLYYTISNEFVSWQDSSAQTLRMYRLAWAFVAHICKMSHFVLPDTTYQTLSMLGKMFRCSFMFFQKTSFNILCKLSSKEIIWTILKFVFWEK